MATGFGLKVKSQNAMTDKVKIKIIKTHDKFIFVIVEGRLTSKMKRALKELTEL